ncbi:ABC transporter permease [Adhaeribacter aerolatus]|uniref:ABC transporter permease n=2 Tax=Adhaeribacter aerolatus TaxID=670289 RepID=A0A512B3M5_9BACT|nr:ABC transporter permease [Adhaeribacter aerolatus]
MALGLLVYQYYTIDSIQVNKDRMYYLKTYAPDGNGYSQTSFPLLYEIQKVAPEVEAATHIQSWNWPWLKYGSREAQGNTAYVDTDFFKVFSYKLKSGNRETALSQKFSVVISEALEKQLFGAGKGLGKIVAADDSILLTVTGVLEKISSNSSIKAEVLLPMALLSDTEDFKQGSNWYNTFASNYLLLHKGSDPKRLDQKINTIFQQYSPPEVKSNTVKTVPFAQITQEGDTNISAIVAVAAAVFILLIVMVNLLNLNAATMFTRTKEVAVRQMLGSGKRSIIIQFCVENALIMLVSLLAGYLVFTNFLLPQMNKIISPNFGEVIFQWQQDYLLVLLFALCILVLIVIAGSYPALHLTSVKVTDTIKGNISSKGDKKSVRNTFIGLQFTLAIILIGAALILNQQIGFMKMASLGFDKDNVVVINLDLAFKNPKTAAGKFEVILNSLRNNPYVNSFSTTREIPTQYWSNYNDYIDVETNKKVKLRQPNVDAGFARTYEIPVAQGRNFKDDLAASEGRSIMLNETAVKAFGWTNPVGKQIRPDGGDNEVLTIVGVMKDFHYSDLQKPIEPLVHAYRGKPGLDYSKYLSINLDMRHSKAVLTSIEKQFKGMPARRPFTYHYMNDLVGEQYNLLSGILKITNYVAFLTIAIACMGMLGLIALSTRRRVKEIGIRKVLGASVLDITALISKDFVRIILVAIIIATPIAWYAMHIWLQDFAYQIKIQWWMFALAGVLAIFIALITISFLAIKAAVANPVKSLRTE